MLMGHDTYSVVHCSPDTGEFHSECVYNSTSGYQQNCVCVGSDREPNLYYYAGSLDFRGMTSFSKDIFTIVRGFISIYFFIIFRIKLEKKLNKWGRALHT